MRPSWLTIIWMRMGRQFERRAGGGAVLVQPGLEWRNRHGRAGYLFELGDVYSAGGGWALVTDPSGSGLSFVSGSNGMLTTYLAAGIGGWVSNTWHQVVLSYSVTNTQLFLDGALAAGGPGLGFEPEFGDAAGGMVLWWGAIATGRARLGACSMSLRRSIVR